MALRQYFSSVGTATRREVWGLFTLYAALWLVTVILLSEPRTSAEGVLGLVLTVAAFVAWIASIARRLRVLHRSQGWLLCVLTPVTGLLLHFYCACVSDPEGYPGND
jgi:uncharacterized membrane protein YhaH (DUF805 family)